MSVDPFIQSPGNSQSMNPYSYIMNNPLAGTDPSGYTSKAEDEVVEVETTVKDADIRTDGEGNYYTKDKNGEIIQIDSIKVIPNGSNQSDTIVGDKSGSPESIGASPSTSQTTPSQENSSQVLGALGVAAQTGVVATENAALLQKSGQVALTGGQASVLASHLGENPMKLAAEANKKQLRLATGNQIVGRIGLGITVFVAANDIVKRVEGEIGNSELAISLAKNLIPAAIGISNAPLGLLAGVGVLTYEVGSPIVKEEIKQIQKMMKPLTPTATKNIFQILQSNTQSKSARNE